MSSLLSICHHARLNEKMEEKVEHKEEEVEKNQKRMGRRSHVLFTGRCSEVARWVTEWRVTKVVEDHEEGEEEEKEPIHSLVGRGGGRHEEEGWRGDILIGHTIVLCLLLMTILS
mmetsp:Transcript_30775/g.52624  ORF Transcript_30775/g.52624 Transcript_30775/m.52624 type:complete len:115 (+) Transcript_30775:52-396(+)